jgi:glycosyltransferase involved in cell wall biosynthesis
MTTLSQTNPGRSPHRPLRILHVLYKMDRGGAETWLMHILRHIDRQRFHFDFLVHDPSPGAYNAEAQSLGARVIFCPYPHWPWTYARQFKQILRDYGPYDIIHSHLSRGGFYLFWAAHLGVSVRIAHNHADELLRQRSLNTFKKISIKLSNFLVDRYATMGLAPSNLAAIGRFGPNWQADPRWSVLFYGIDLHPFKVNFDSSEVREELGIPPDAFVIGHVGRFAKQKNHHLIIQIAQELGRQDRNFRLLLVGIGPLRPDIENLVHQFGLQDKVIFTGMRPDVPRLMKGAMDVFLFPSFCETLGIVLVEAQAAGLPCVLSDTIPAEAEVVKPLCRRQSLADTPSKWAAAVLAAREVKITPAAALDIVEQSNFNIESSCRKLTALYLNQISQAERADVQ